MTEIYKDGVRVESEVDRGEAGHTPGPWGVEFGTYTLWVGPNQSGRVKLADVVVSMDYGPNYRPEFYARQKANARLLAAAPELLDAVRPLLPGSEKDAEHLDGMDDDERITITIPIRVIRRAMDVCEKATGRRCVDALLDGTTQP